MIEINTENQGFVAVDGKLLVDKWQVLDDCGQFLSKYGIIVDKKKIISDSRHDEDNVIRALIAFYLVNNTNLNYSLDTIGQILGGRTHATVINMLKYNQKHHPRNAIYNDISLKILIDLGKHSDEIGEYEHKINELKKKDEIVKHKVIFESNNPNQINNQMKTKRTRKRKDWSKFKDGKRPSNIFFTKSMEEAIVADCQKHKREFKTHVEYILDQYSKGNIKIKDEVSGQWYDVNTPAEEVEKITTIHEVKEELAEVTETAAEAQQKKEELTEKLEELNTNSETNEAPPATDKNTESN